ncbi:MAG: DUF6807 domain-containing protein, partial [Planctomycetota bacterium]
MKRSLIGLIAGALVFAGGCQLGPRVEFVKGDDKIGVMIGDKHFTNYLYRNELTKPILYPVYTPSGIMVNRGYPLVEVEGESTDHPHHAGIFFTYDRVNDDGFWNNTTSPPQVKHVKVTKMKGGTGKGKLSTVMHWIGKSGKVLLEEKRNMVFLVGEEEYIIDFSINLTAPDTKVIFKDTKEGMFAIRVADWLREKGGSGRYLNSNGDETENNVWGKRAKWVRLQGEKDGKTIGIAILNHPRSVNYPTYWHARRYGLFSANPLGQYDFEKKWNPQTAKPLNFALEPGEVAHFRFQTVIYEGE